MPHIRLDDRNFELSVGESRIGTEDDAVVRLDAASETGTLAIITVDARGAVAVHRTAAQATVSVNGVALGAEPTPLLHGDRIDVAGRQLRFSDDRKAGSTVLMPALSGSIVAAAPAGLDGAGASGGRLVSLTDGREYPVPGEGLRIGRDAACDVVVPGSDVSRQHAELSLGSRGYVLRDLSTNGVFVNGHRTGDAQPLRRGDVIRIGSEELRFYAEEMRGKTSESAVGVVGSRKPVPAGSGGAERLGAGVAAGARPPGERRAPVARPPVVAAGPGAAENIAGPPRMASALAWIAAALVIGATLIYVLQDRS